jgi:hypothetical protein
LWGATLTSWICDGVERIFLSENAIFNEVKAIRGGIPLVFPQFGNIRITSFLFFFTFVIYVSRQPSQIPQCLSTVLREQKTGQSLTLRV